LNIVFKISGHVILNDELNINLLKEYYNIFRETYDGGRWVIVVGGGKPARRYVESARMLGLNEGLCDEIGIKITRINAMIISNICILPCGADALLCKSRYKYEHLCYYWYSGEHEHE